MIAFGILMDYRKLYEKDGDHYFVKICEELGELQTAFLHFTQDKASMPDVIEEIADVQIQIEKMIAYIAKFDDFKAWHTEKHISEIKEIKLKQLKEITNGLSGQ